jgi:heterodisulfide reductase subunit A-like polyferredoxin
MSMLYEKKGRYIVEFPDVPTDRQHQIEIEIEARRLNYEEVELGFDEQRARLEARRCLSCRRCLGCALCWAECTPEAIVFEMEDETMEIEADSVIIAPGVERTLERIDKKFGWGRYSNVITDLQFERMLSDAGPSGGLIIRPFDGDLPHSIAFLQSYESASPKMHRAALCFAVNEAVLARRKLQDAEIAVFAGNLEEFRQENQQTLTRLERIELRETTLTALEPTETEGLSLSFNGTDPQQPRVFDLVVLITQQQISKEAKDLSKSLGLSLSYASFLTNQPGAIISTDKDPITLAARP